MQSKSGLIVMKSRWAFKVKWPQYLNAPVICNQVPLGSENSVDIDLILSGYMPNSAGTL